MSRQNALKLAHFAGTAWFALSVIYILVLALQQASTRWWVIVSLSGYSTLAVFLLISLYLFAIFRGVSRSQKRQAEHPLTTSLCYSAFYGMSPFLGGLAGGLAAIGASRLTDYLLVVAVGSFCVTFLVWIVVDPLVGLLEMLPPSVRHRRRKRLAQAKAVREKQRLAKQRLLAEVQAKEEREWVRWGELLRPCAERLASLAADGETASTKEEAEAVDIGVKAWQMGGLSCMRRLHSMAIEMCERKLQGARIVDHVSIWWNGIGNWRDPSLG
jgi:hypothetical protein